MPRNIAIKPCFALRKLPSIDEIIDLSLAPSALLSKIARLAASIALAHKIYIGAIGSNLNLLERHIRATHQFDVFIAMKKNSTSMSIAARLSDQRFWRRHIYRLILRRREHRAFISKQLGYDRPEKCCTTGTVDIMQYKKEKNRQFLLAQNKVVKSSLGSDNPVVFNLAQAAESAEQSRMNECFLTIKSLSTIAERKGYCWALVTFTATSEYHPNPRYGNSKRLSEYDPKNTFRDGAEYLNKGMFYKFQKSLDKKFKRGEDYFGFKVIEVHDDGCPHMHFLIFYIPVMQDFMIEKIKNLYLSDRPEWYFDKFKDKLIKIGVSGSLVDGVKQSASAASYIYKYLAFALAPQVTGDLDVNLATRYKCAINAAGCRQYSFFGVRSSLTKRRALAKISKMKNAPRHIKEMACRLHVPKEEEGRNAKQLEASIKFITEDAMLLEFEKEAFQNKYEESGLRVVSIKHHSDSNGVPISGLCADISEHERESLTSCGSNGSLVGRAPLIRKILERSAATVIVNYSSKSIRQKHRRKRTPKQLRECKLYRRKKVISRLIYQAVRNSKRLPDWDKSGPHPAISDALQALQMRRAVRYVPALGDSSKEHYPAYARALEG